MLAPALVLALVLSSPVHAAINKCRMSTGSIGYTDGPCPPGTSLDGRFVSEPVPPAAANLNAPAGLSPSVDDSVSDEALIEVPSSPLSSASSLPGALVPQPDHLAAENPVLLIGALILLVVCFVGYVRQVRGRGRSPAAHAPGPAPSTQPSPGMSRAALYSKLVGACFGDKSKADRLIRFETDKAPSISDAEAITRALDRLRNDRSRYN